MRSAVSLPNSPALISPAARVLILSAVLLLGLTLLGVVPAADAAERPRKERPIAAKTLAPDEVQLAAMPSASAGGEHSCGIRSTGTLWCWGRNNFGQIGSGKYNAEPVPPTQVGLATDWRQVDASGSNSCAVRTNNFGYCWGLNNRGQVGDGSKLVRNRPQLIRGGAVWSKLSTSWFHTCGIRTNQTLWCWGDNSAGQLGRGNTKQSLAMTQVAGRYTEVSTGGWTTCARSTNALLWCWGRNDFGQLGNGTFKNAYRPTRVAAGVGGIDVDVSWTHACGVIGAGRVTYCWGRNTNSQLGNRNTVNNARPQRVLGAPAAGSVSAAEGTSCVVGFANQGLWCWGDNRYGQVGGTGYTVTAPRRRAGNYTATSGGWLHTCAEAVGNKAVCWGNNERGQLGNGRGFKRPVPERPAPRVLKQKAGPLSFKLASLNILGNGHSRPYAHDDRFGPSRMRAEWAGQALLAGGIQVAGTQEADAGQLQALLAATNDRFQAYPAPARGHLAVEASIVWDTRKFDVVKRTTITTQFIARKLKRPVVRLKDKATGRQFFVMNVHNAPRGQQAKRNAATKVQIQKLKELEKTGLPVYFVGDMNEKLGLFCKVLRRTGLNSASGGSVSGGKCRPPKGMRVDWIFGSENTRWRNFNFSRPPLVRYSTDHTMPVVNVLVP